MPWRQQRRSAGTVWEHWGECKWENCKMFHKWENKHSVIGIYYNKSIAFVLQLILLNEATLVLIDDCESLLDIIAGLGTQTDLGEEILVVEGVSSCVGNMGKWWTHALMEDGVLKIWLLTPSYPCMPPVLQRCQRRSGLRRMPSLAEWYMKQNIKTRNVCHHTAQVYLVQFFSWI